MNGTPQSSQMIWMADRISELEDQVWRLTPKSHGKWIFEYPEEVFVVFDPTDDGSNIITACRTLAQAEYVLSRVE
jgi:hypothetical protein